jgi:hypothetical protein
LACVRYVIVNIMHKSNNNNNNNDNNNNLGRVSVVGIETGYGLDGSEIESRWEARNSALDQAGPGVHLASCTVGTGSLSRE